jgi:hypothetical protein
VIFFAIVSNRCHHGCTAEDLQEVMVSISIRTLLVPGVAFATAGAVALGPAMVAPPAVTLAQPVVALPVVTIPDVQLAGFTLDLYNALNGWVQFGIQVAQDFFFWNPSFAAQIGNSYTFLEPIVTAVVAFIDTLASGPADIIGALTSLVSSVFGIGLPSLTAASVGNQSVLRAAASRKSDGPRASASVPVLESVLPAPAEVAADAAPDAAPDIAPDAASAIPARASRGEVRRGAGSAAVGARQTARAAAADVGQVVAEVEQAVAAASTAAPETQVRKAARSARGAVAKAATEARAAVTAGADAAR